MEEYPRIHELIAKKITHGLSKEEDRELEMWLGESENNRELFRKITDQQYIISQEQKRNMIPVDACWEQIGYKIGERKKQFSRRIIAYAAIVSLLCGLGVASWHLRKFPKEEKGLAEQINPGNVKAKLVLANGERIDLGEKQKEKQLIYQDGIVIRNDSAGLSYDIGEKAIQKIVHHKIIVPKGGEYVMRLSDGSTVYLNSESIIEYPIKFTGDSREVYLEGEAYFKVMGDKNCPFIVRTRNMDVKVFGTEFNVKAYTDEKLVQTTLVRGQVSVFTGKNKSIENKLFPSQQAELDLNSILLKVDDIDIQPFIAWINGQFIFKENTLEEIMTTLKRWYDFEVFYQSEWIKEIKFAGKLNRSGSIEPILDVIRLTQKVNVSVKGKTIVFSDK